MRSKGKNENHPLVQLKEAWKQMQYPPETATIMLFAKIIAMINQSNDKAEAVSVFSQFCNKLTSNDQGLEINFLGEKFVEKVEVLRQMLQQTVNTEYVPHVRKKNCEKIIFWFNEAIFNQKLFLDFCHFLV